MRASHQRAYSSSLPLSLSCLFAAAHFRGSRKWKPAVALYNLSDTIYSATTVGRARHRCMTQKGVSPSLT